MIDSTVCAICGAPTDYKPNGNGHANGGHAVCDAHRALATRARDVRKCIEKKQPDEAHAIRARKLWAEMDSDAKFGLSLVIVALLDNYNKRRAARGDSRCIGPVAGLELVVALLEAGKL